MLVHRLRAARWSHDHILALGRSRLPEAFEALKACWQRQPPATLRETTLLALAMLRLPPATDFLVELLETVPETTALAVLSALKVQAHDPKLGERLKDIVGVVGFLIVFSIIVFFARRLEAWKGPPPDPQ